jgi:hypothetical protein
MDFSPEVSKTIKQFEAFAINMLNNGVYIELNNYELAELKKTICQVNKVRRKGKYEEIPEEELFAKYSRDTTRKLLPELQINEDRENLSWNDKMTLRREQIGQLIAEIKAIDILNGIQSDFKTPTEYK